MIKSNIQKSDKAVALWLLAGVVMIMVQVLLGGITRLTESGLSITEWKPITGMLPPMGEAAWQAEFDKYKNTDQFRYIHADFSLSDFKFIFFWEWFHRVWARLLGLVFLAGFMYFLVKGKFRKEMVAPLIWLFILGGVQGFIGWIMVSSGLLPEKLYVGHVELATHFLAALGLLAYTFWFALRLLVPVSEHLQDISLRKGLYWLLFFFIVQLGYGAFMAGLKAATVAPTWPTINGSWWPIEEGTFLSGADWINNTFLVHFIHRNLAYALAIGAVIWWWISRKQKGAGMFGMLRNVLLTGIILQVVLGIFTVLSGGSPKALLWLGVTHQFVAMMLLLVITGLIYLMSPPRLNSGSVQQN